MARCMLLVGLFAITACVSSHEDDPVDPPITSDDADEIVRDTVVDPLALPTPVPAARIQFAPLPEYLIDRAIAASTGYEAREFERNFLYNFEHPPQPDPCPTITVDAQAGLVTIAGNNCVRADYMIVRGSAVVQNPRQWGTFTGDPQQPTHYVFDQFETEQFTFVETVDGTFTRDGNVDEIDLTYHRFNAELYTRARVECTTSACLASGIIELVGGSAATTATMAPRGALVDTQLEMRGADTLTYEAGDGCTSWRISGSDRYRIEC